LPNFIVYIIYNIIEKVKGWEEGIGRALRATSLTLASGRVYSSRHGL